MILENISHTIIQANDFLKESLSFDSIKKNQEKQMLLKVCDIGLMKYREYFKIDNIYTPELYLKYINNVCEYLFIRIYKKDTLELDDILGLHAVIMGPIQAFEHIKHIGLLRTIPLVTREKNYLKGLSEAFISHYQVEKKTKEALTKYNEEIQNNSKKLEAITTLYIQFLAKIHLFENGNGRCMFILLDTLLFKYDFFPLFMRHHEKKRDTISENYIIHRNIGRLQSDLHEVILDIYTHYQIT